MSSNLIWCSLISILDNEIQENNEFDEITFFKKKIEISKNNPELTKDNTICQLDSFKNFKILVACLKIAGKRITMDRLKIFN